MTPVAANLPRLVVLALFALVLTGHAVVSRWTAPVFDDVAEAWAWGRQLELGYYKHPPFYAYLARVWFEIAGRSDVSAYLLAGVNAAVGLAGIYRFSRCFLGEAESLLATLLATLLPQYTVMATNFNANTVLLSLWPWTAYVFVRSLRSRSALDGALFGVLAGLCLLSKYTSAVLLVSCLATAVIGRDRRVIFASPAPYAALAAMVVVVALHAEWLVANDFPPLKWATRRAGEDFDVKLFKALSSLLAFLALLAPMLAGLTFALGRRAAAGAAAATPSPAEGSGATLAIVALGPLGLVALLGTSGLVLMQTNYLIPLAFALPTLVVSRAAGTIAQRALTRAFWLVVGAAGALLLASPLVAYSLQFKEINHTNDPTARAAQVATAAWRARTGEPVRLVSGTEVYSLGLAFYSPDRPAEFTHFNFAHAPWVTPERIRREGLLVVCGPGDERCASNAEAWANGKTERVAVELEVRHLGVLLAKRPIRIFVIPPVP